MTVDLELLTDEEIYERLMREEIPAARRSLVIATALVKQTTVELAPGDFGPFLHLVAELIQRGVAVFLLFAGKPSSKFMESLVALPRELWPRMRVCARNHMKVVIIDGQRLYLGSANLTGAGLGRKSRNKRNFEFGIFTTDRRLVERLTSMISAIWDTSPCETCQAKRLCFRENARFQAALSGSVVDLQASSF